MWQDDTPSTITDREEHHIKIAQKSQGCNFSVDQCLFWFTQIEAELFLTQLLLTSTSNGVSLSAAVAGLQSQQLIFQNSHTVGMLYANGTLNPYQAHCATSWQVSKCGYILKFCAKSLDEDVCQWTPISPKVVRTFHWCQLVCVVALRSFGCVSAKTCQRWGVCVCLCVHQCLWHEILMETV